MRTFVLLFALVAAALACDTLDLGVYTCTVDAPSSSPSTAVFTVTSGGTYTLTVAGLTQGCIAAGTYATDEDTLTITDTDGFLDCVVNSDQNLESLVFACDFDSDCNQFECVTSQENGSTSFDCDATATASVSSEQSSQSNPVTGGSPQSPESSNPLTGSKISNPVTGGSPQSPESSNPLTGSKISNPVTGGSPDSSSSASLFAGILGLVACVFLL